MIRSLFIIFFNTSIALGAFSQDQIIFSGERISEEEISIEQLYIEAYQKKILQKYEDAIELYEKILKTNEIMPSVHHDMAEMYVSMKENEKALSSARKAVRYAPNNQWFFLTLVEIYESTMEYELAARTIDNVIEIAPNAGLYHRKAHNLELANKKNEALITYDLADKLYGKDTYRSDSKVDIYLSMGNKKDAIREVKKWSDDEPENVEYWTKLAKFYEFIGELKDSRKTYLKVLELDPENEEALFKTRKDATEGKINSEMMSLINDQRIGIDNKIKSLLPLLSKEENLEELKELCASLIAQYPENAKTYALYGDVLWLNKDAEGAIPLYEKALTINKSVYEVWEQLMMALAQEKKYDRLSSLAREAQDFYPNQAGPYYYFALSAYALGDFEKALEANEEASFIASIGGGYIHEQTLILQARTIDAQGETKSAISFIESISPGSLTASLFEILGDLYIKSGDKAGAERAWKKSIDLGGDKTRLGLKIQSI